MSGSKHYILVNANDKESAIELIESILDKSECVSWYDINYVLDLKQVYNKEPIEKILAELNKEFSEDRIEKFMEYIDTLNMRLDSGDNHIYYLIGEAYMDLFKMTQRAKYDDFTFDNLMDAESFNGWKYNEYGLTNCIIDNDDNVYFVEVNVHL